MTARIPQQSLKKTIKQPVHIYDFMHTVQHNGPLNPAFMDSIDVHQKDRFGNTVLYWAMFHQNIQNVKILLYYGCALEVTADGKNAAFFAIDTNNLEILAYLAEQGTNLNVHYKQESLLEYAKRLGRKEMNAYLRKRH